MIISSTAALAAAMVSTADAPAAPVQIAPATPFAMPRSESPEGALAARPKAWYWHIQAF